MKRLSRTSVCGSRFVFLDTIVPSDEHFRSLERMYASAAINEDFRPVLRVGDSTAEVRIVVRPDFHHAAHAAHGSVYFKALDDAAFFAANSIVSDVFVLTVTFNVVLLRPIAAGTMIANGTLVHRSRNLLVAESELRDERDRVLARGNGTFARSTIPLDEKVGYR